MLVVESYAEFTYNAFQWLVSIIPYLEMVCLQDTHFIIIQVIVIKSK